MSWIPGTLQCLSMTCRNHYKSWYSPNLANLLTMEGDDATQFFFQCAHVTYIKYVFYVWYTSNHTIDYHAALPDGLKKEICWVCKSRPVCDLLELARYCFDRERVRKARMMRLKQWYYGYNRRTSMSQKHVCIPTMFEAIGYYLAANNRPVEYKEWCTHYQRAWNIKHHEKAARMGHVQLLVAFPTSFYTSSCPNKPLFFHYRFLIQCLLYTTRPVAWDVLLDSKAWKAAWIDYMNPSTTMIKFYIQNITKYLTGLTNVWVHLSADIQVLVQAQKSEILNAALSQYTNSVLLAFVLDVLEAPWIYTEHTLLVLRTAFNAWKKSQTVLHCLWKRGLLSLVDAPTIDIGCLIQPPYQRFTINIQEWFMEHPFPGSDIIVEEIACLM